MNEAQPPHLENLMAVRRLIRPRGVGTLPTVSAFLSLVLGGCGGERAAPVGPSASDTVARAAPDTVVASIRITPSERTIGILGNQFQTGAAALAADGTTLYRLGSTLPAVLRGRPPRPRSHP